MPFTWSIQHRRDTAANWTAANPVLLDGQEGLEYNESTDAYDKRKVGDGVTAWNDLPYHGGGGSFASLTGAPSDNAALQAELDAKQDRVSELLTGGVVTVGDYDSGGVDDDIRATAATYFVQDHGSYSAPQNEFYNIENCASGLLKSIGIFGKNDNTIIKVEGDEGAGAVPPDTPEGCVPIKYITWGDAGSVSSQNPSGSTDPRVTSVASTSTITLDCSTTDHYEVYALAANVTIAAPLNPVDGAMKLYVFKDNGNARTITRNAIFKDLTGGAPTSTTAGKVTVEGVRYSSARTRWEILVSVTEP